MNTRVVSVDEVLHAEAEEILLRRNAAGLHGPSASQPHDGNGKLPHSHSPASTSQPSTAEPSHQAEGSDENSSVRAQSARTSFPTVGLAFSGGGIRSGCVSLGFLQSLYRRGILRHMDYLSTVSGGGYAGAFFSSLVMDSRYPRIDWTPERPSSHMTPLEILPDDSGRQPKLLQPLLFGGERLKDPLPFASRWFLGVLLLNLTIVSGLVGLAAFAAFILRLVDVQPARIWLKEIGIVSDVARAFLVPVIALLLWLMAVAAARHWPRCRQVVTPLFAVFCATLAMGICSYLTVADVSVPAVEIKVTEPSELRESLSAWSDRLGTYLLAALGAALLPYLNPRGLLRSGAQPHNAIEKWTFGIASRAFLFGVPLVVFAFFVRENVSGTTTADPTGIHHVFLDPFDRFWQRVKWEKEATAEPGTYLWDEVNNKLQATLEREKATPVPLVAIVADSERLRNEDSSIRNGLVKLARIFQPWQWPAIQKGYAIRAGNVDDRNRVAAALNDVLASHKFTDKFRWQAQMLKASSHDENRLEQLLAHAKGLPTTADGAKDPSDEALQAERRRLNWDLLCAHYGGIVRERGTVYASVVVDDDQRFRLKVSGMALIVLLVTGLLIDLNAISLHGYYRQKLGELWINEAPQYGYHIPIRKLATTSKGGPYHLINGTLNLMRRGVDTTRCGTGRFTFSKRYCGSNRTGYARTDFYCGGRVDLADAIGISGAAMSAATVPNPLARALMLVLNFRLGQWVPNPARKSTGSWWAAPMRLFVNWLRHADPKDRSYCFVTDGGHDENTSIGALLERRCRVIIAVDATHDPDYQFVDFLKLVRVAVAEHGVHIADLHCDSKALSLSELKPDKLKGTANSHFLVARITYPPPTTSVTSQVRHGYLILVKPNLTGDEPTELAFYRNENPVFPHDPTLDQFFEPRRFACYRQLGEHLGDKLCEQFFHASAWPQADEDGPWLAERWVPPRVKVKSFQPDFTEGNCDAVLSALNSGDEVERAAAFTILTEFAPDAKLKLRKRAVEALVVSFDRALRQRKPAAVCDMLKMIAYIGKGMTTARQLILDIAEGKPRGGYAIPEEVQVTARFLAAGPKGKQQSQEPHPAESS